MTWNVKLASNAQNEIDEIFYTGLRNWGTKIAQDYDQLINQALKDLGENPYRIGTQKVSGRFDELYVYDLVYSKKNIEVNIKKPAHSVFYFIVENNAVLVASISRRKREKYISKIDRQKSINDTQEVHNEEEGM